MMHAMAPHMQPPQPNPGDMQQAQQQGWYWWEEMFCFFSTGVLRFSVMFTLWFYLRFDTL
jgi:hypothetical protein